MISVLITKSGKASPVNDQFTAWTGMLLRNNAPDIATEMNLRKSDVVLAC